MTDEELIARLRACANGIGSFKSHQGDYGICDDAADRIEALIADFNDCNSERIRWKKERYAASAAAYEAAAQTCDNVTNNTTFTRDIRRTSSYCAERIRILATPDQTAALGKLIAEAEARGKRIGAASEKIARLTEWLNDDEDNIYLLPQDDVMKMRTILAAIPKQEQNHD